MKNKKEPEITAELHKRLKYIVGQIPTTIGVQIYESFVNLLPLGAIPAARNQQISSYQNYMSYHYSKFTEHCRPLLVKTIELTHDMPLLAEYGSKWITSILQQIQSLFGHSRTRNEYIPFDLMTEILKGIKIDIEDSISIHYTNLIFFTKRHFIEHYLSLEQYPNKNDNNGKVLAKAIVNVLDLSAKARAHDKDLFLDFSNNDNTWFSSQIGLIFDRCVYDVTYGIVPTVSNVASFAKEHYLKKGTKLPNFIVYLLDELFDWVKGFAEQSKITVTSRYVYVCLFLCVCCVLCVLCVMCWFCVFLFFFVCECNVVV